MKLPIKKEYFDLVKAGIKQREYRDAHITFVCEETGETLRRDVVGVEIADRNFMPEEIRDSPMFEDESIIVFKLEE